MNGASNSVIVGFMMDVMGRRLMEFESSSSFKMLVVQEKTSVKEKSSSNLSCCASQPVVYCGTNVFFWRGLAMDDFEERIAV